MKSWVEIFKEIAGSVLLILGLIFLMMIVFCCRPVRTVTKADASVKAETSIQETGTKDKEGHVARQTVTEVEHQKSRSEHQTGGSVLLSQPDSVGKQWPFVVNWYSNDVGETVKTTGTIRAEYEAKFAEMEKRFAEMESKMDVKTNDETVSKTGFTFLEKTGMAAMGLLVLIIIYTVFKFLLKRQIIRL